MRLLRKKSIAGDILKGIALAGLFVVAAGSPYFATGLIRGFNKLKNKEKWRKFYRSLNYLDRRGYVKINEKENGNIEIKLTGRGKTTIEKFNFDELKLSLPGKWDGRWRLVIFDVPNFKHKNRLALSQKLKDLGFIMVQKSVWAYPFECYKEIAIIRKFYEVEQYVTYLEVVEIEDELHWRSRFNLGPGANLS